MTLNTEYLKSCSASCTHINCLGILLYAYVCFLTNSFLSFSFFVFKEGFNEKNVIKKQFRGLNITVVKENTQNDIHVQKY